MNAYEKSTAKSKTKVTICKAEIAECKKEFHPIKSKIAKKAKRIKELDQIRLARPGGFLNCKSFTDEEREEYNELYYKCEDTKALKKLESKLEKLKSKLTELESDVRSDELAELLWTSPMLTEARANATIVYKVLNVLNWLIVISAMAYIVYDTGATALPDAPVVISYCLAVVMCATGGAILAWMISLPMLLVDVIILQPIRNLITRK